MKKRTGIIGVLIAILVLGLGYAAITGVDLLVDGTGKVVPDSENFAVHYDTANAPTVTIGTGVKDTATVTATYTDGSTEELTNGEVTFTYEESQIYYVSMDQTITYDDVKEFMAYSHGPLNGIAEVYKP